LLVWNTHRAEKLTSFLITNFIPLCGLSITVMNHTVLCDHFGGAQPAQRRRGIKTKKRSVRFVQHQHVRLRLSAKSASQSAVFFSYKKSASNTFSQPDQPKRTGHATKKLVADYGASKWMHAPDLIENAPNASAKL
jgi:hypothetical protein